MTDDTITIKKSTTHIFKVDVSEVPDYIDDVEEWAKDNALINTPAAEKVETKYGQLEIIDKGNKNGDSGE